MANGNNYVARRDLTVRDGAEYTPMEALVRQAAREVVMVRNNRDPARMRPFAVIETTSTQDVLERVLDDPAHVAAFGLQECAQSPHGYSWFNVCIDATDPLAALKTIRSVLVALLRAADLGIVGHFRIVTGADLLRGPEPAAGGGEVGGGEWAV